MRLFSVNVGKAWDLENAGKSGKTGIYKLPTREPVRITARGLIGDEICDTRHHGGADQAVYLYGVEDYGWWELELGHPLEPGTFGENLTLAGLESAEYRVGDRFRITDVVLEVTSPRIPCGTLAARMRDRHFPSRFQQAERPGLYCRVIQEGIVQAGAEVTVQPYSGETISAIEMFRDFYKNDLDEATLRRTLAAPIDVRTRAHMEQLLRERLG